MSDLHYKALSSFTTLILNGGIFAGMAWAGFAGEHQVKEPGAPPFDWVDVAPVVRKGVIKDEKALPRIKAAPAPPPVETDTASLSREREEAEERAKEEEKKKRELAEKERRDEIKRKHQEERDRKKREAQEAKQRRAAAAAAMRDVRADDEDAPEGRPDGSEFGTSTDPNASRNQAMYVSLVSTVLSRQFEVPSNVSPAERKRLKAKVHFFIDKNGKLKGQPKLSKSSGNKFFDNAALRAVKKFSAGSALRIPLPEKKGLKKFVLQSGITAIMQKG